MGELLFNYCLPNILSQCSDIQIVLSKVKHYSRTVSEPKYRLSLERLVSIDIFSMITRYFLAQNNVPMMEGTP